MSYLNKLIKTKLFLFRMRRIEKRKKDGNIPIFDTKNKWSQTED